VRQRYLSFQSNSITGKISRDRSISTYGIPIVARGTKVYNINDRMYWVHLYPESGGPIYGYAIFCTMPGNNKYHKVGQLVSTRGGLLPWASSNSHIEQRMIVHLCVLGTVITKTGYEMEHVHGIPSTIGLRNQEHESWYGAILTGLCKPSAG